MSGPTLFGPLLSNAAARAQSLAACTPHQQSYSVLLILTDGCINDMRQTIEVLVSMSDVPISVVIVGVGDADFSSMVELDGDDGPLRSGAGAGGVGRYATRDVVQFVPFARHRDSPSRLAAETLAEVPKQMVQYMMKRGILPMPPTKPPGYGE